MADFNTNPHVGSPLGAYPANGAGSESSGSGEGDCNENCVLDCETLVSAATQPASITVDGQIVVEKSLNDLINLDKHLKNKKALCNMGGSGWGAVAKARVVLPSATGGC